MLRWVLIAAGILGVTGVATYVIGMLLPRNHTARLEGIVARAPAEVAAILRNVRNYPSWRRDVAVTDLTQTADGITYVELVNKDRIAYRLTEPVLGEKFVATMTDQSLPFGGTWTITLAPEGADTRVAIQEDGEVRNPIFRVFAHFVFGYTASMQTYLEDLGATVVASPET